MGPRRVRGQAGLRRVAAGATRSGRSEEQPARRRREPAQVVDDAEELVGLFLFLDPKLGVRAGQGLCGAVARRRCFAVHGAAESSEIGMGAMRESGLAMRKCRLLEQESFGSHIFLLCATQIRQCVSRLGSDCWRPSYLIQILVMMSCSPFSKQNMVCN
jgi:hypothetical protein